MLVNPLFFKKGCFPHVPFTGKITYIQWFYGRSLFTIIAIKIIPLQNLHVYPEEKADINIELPLHITY